MRPKFIILGNLMIRAGVAIIKGIAFVAFNKIHVNTIRVTKLPLTIALLNRIESRIQSVYERYVLSWCAQCYRQAPRCVIPVLIPIVLLYGCNNESHVTASWYKRLKDAYPAKLAEDPDIYRDIAKQASSDPNHIEMLREFFQECEEDEYDIGLAVLGELAHMEPRSEYLELCNYIKIRHHKIDIGLICELVYANYSMRQVGAEIIQILESDIEYMDRMSCLRSLADVAAGSSCFTYSDEIRDICRNVLNDLGSHLITKLESVRLLAICGIISKNECCEIIKSVLSNNTENIHEYNIRKVKDACECD